MFCTVTFKSVPLQFYFYLNSYLAIKKSEIQLASWDWVEMWLVWGFAQWASGQRNLLDLDNQIVFFFQALFDFLKAIDIEHRINNTFDS